MCILTLIFIRYKHCQVTLPSNGLLWSVLTCLALEGENLICSSKIPSSCTAQPFSLNCRTNIWVPCWVPGTNGEQTDPSSFFAELAVTTCVQQYSDALHKAEKLQPLSPELGRTCGAVRIRTGQRCRSAEEGLPEPWLLSCDQKGQLEEDESEKETKPGPEEWEEATRAHRCPVAAGTVDGPTQLGVPVSGRGGGPC